MDNTKIPEQITISLNAIKGFAKYLLIPAGIITFTPDKWLVLMRMLALKNSYGVWIALTFFVCLSIVVIDIFQSEILSRYQSHNGIKNLEKSLLNLNSTEKTFLKNIFDNDSYTFPFNNASVDKLEQLAVITRPAMSVEYDNFSYTLQPWAYSYLQKHPEYFEDIPNE